MVKAKDVARIFAYMSREYTGKDIPNTSLNKLLYFAQGHMLARTGKPLFENAIDAWQFGPVVPVVESNYRKIIQREAENGIDDIEITPEEMETVCDVWAEYGEKKANELVAITHEAGTPWSLTYQSGEKNRHIPVEVIKEYFERPENKLSSVLDTFKTQEAAEALPAAEYDPDEDAIWEALLHAE